MSEPRIFAGDYADFKLVKTRGVAQIVVEVPIEDGEQVVRLFGIPQPGKPRKLALAVLTEGSVASEVERGRLSGKPTGSDSLAEVDGSNPSGAAARREWSSLSPAQQAGMRCTEPAFQLFLRERGDASCTDANKAAEYVRFVCGVKSRADIGKSNAAIAKWRDLDRSFQAWMSSPDPGTDPLEARSDAAA